MPVAAKERSPVTMSRIVYLRPKIDDAGGARARAMLLVGGDQPSLHLAADAGERRGREHAFRRAADAHIDVDAGLQRLGDVDHAGDIAVADQAERCARRPHLLDQLGVARPVEDADGDLADRHALCASASALRLSAGDASRSTRPFGKARADGDLVHIDGRHLEQTAALGDGEHRERVGQRLGAERGALDRIDGEIDLGPVARAPTVSPI